MGDLILSGTLNFTGRLNLMGRDGGKVTVDGKQVLVEVTKGQGDAHSLAGIPVILPPPPAPSGPIDPGTNVWIFKSFNATVTANGVNIITQGICAQGNPGTATWPGMVLPSINNPTVTINGIAMNVKEDTGITLSNGGPVTFTNSGQ
jgi:hypothetical protein